MGELKNMKKLWIKIRVRLELWHDAIEHWFDTHVRVVSKKAVRQLVQERDLLRESMEELEDQSSTDIEKLTQENDYLKDELAYEHIKNKRLEEEVQTVHDRDFKDIYPGLQATISHLEEENRELRLNMNKFVDGARDFFCERCKEDCTKDDGHCPFDDFVEFTDARIKNDEVPTETSPEDS